MTKSYSEKTQQYLAQNGLVKIYVKNSVGERKAKLVPVSTKKSR